MKPYLLDTNVFIEAHRKHYPLDVVPGFWDKLKELAEQKIILSIDKVEKEIKQNEDELKDWVDGHLRTAFFRDSSTSVETYGEISNWVVQHERYKQHAKDEFLQAELADSWLVAYAKENDCVIVTQEVSAPDSKKRIKIPEVCEAFDVKYLNLVEMFRALGEQF